MKRRIFGLIICIICLWAFKGSVKAEVKFDVDRNYVVSATGEMQISETEKITNRFQDQYVAAGTPRKYTFVISARDPEEREEVANAIYATLKLQINGESVSFNKTKEVLTSKADLYTYGISYVLRKRLNPNTSQQVSISYNHPELASKNGGLFDAYIPAFPDDIDFDDGKYVYTYTTRLKMPKSAGAENILSVEPKARTSEGALDVYSFDQESLRGRFVWVQRGSQQVYKFLISQKLSPTASRASGDLTEYRIVLPRDVDEVNVEQKVYFTEISPEPVALSQDAEGNLIGVFRVPSHEETAVKIAGYAVLKNKPKQNLTKAGTLSELIAKRAEFDRYLEPAEYWEVNAVEISKKAEQIVGDEQDVSQILNKIYANIVGSIDYSQVKRFGINERQGALKTLQGGAAVCMEYSDLYLTLLRNRGIPARAVFGYGFDSRLPADGQEAHQWVQVYLPSYQKWISVDVTWGESGPKVIGGDLNHFYTHVAAVDPNTPAVLSRLSWGRTDAELHSPNLIVETLATLPAGKYSTPADLTAKYPAGETVEGDFFGAILVSKYFSSWSNLFRSPRDLDIQGWAMVIVTFAALILVVVGLIRFVVFLSRRINRRGE